MNLRPADPSEAAAITRLVRAAYAPYVPRIGREPAPMGEDYAALIARGTVFVPADGPSPPDGILVLEDAPGHLLLDAIAVAPAVQGRGLGRALVAAAEDLARARGHPEVRLYTNALMMENLVLYPRLGYEETRRAHENGFDRVFFRKRLAPV